MSTLHMLANMRRPRMSTAKQFACKEQACDKTFYHSHDLYRHQRLKHSAAKKDQTYAVGSVHNTGEMSSFTGFPHVETFIGSAHVESQ